jgi:hypothetical protein
MLISEEAIGIRKNKKCSRATTERRKKSGEKTTTTHPPTVRPIISVNYYYLVG